MRSATGLEICNVRHVLCDCSQGVPNKHPTVRRRGGKPRLGGHAWTHAANDAAWWIITKAQRLRNGLHRLKGIPSQVVSPRQVQAEDQSGYRSVLLVSSRFCEILHVVHILAMYVVPVRAKLDDSWLNYFLGEIMCWPDLVFDWSVFEESLEQPTFFSTKTARELIEFKSNAVLFQSTAELKLQLSTCRL